MDPEDLRTLIDSGSIRISVVQQKRDDIERITGSRPPDDFGEIAEWWENNKSYLSRKVNEQIEDEDEDQEENEEENEEDIEFDEEQNEQDKVTTFTTEEEDNDNE